MGIGRSALGSLRGDRLNRRRVVAGAVGAAAFGASAAPFSRSIGAQDASPAAIPPGQPDMRGAVYPFQIGELSCYAVSDGASIAEDFGLLLFAGTPPERLDEVLSESGFDPSTTPNQHTSILVDTGEQVILVDTGIGPGFSPTEGLLLGNLQAAGYEPEDVDVVVLTHGHGDHIGGNIGSDGAPVFSNAQYVMSEEEWEFWMDLPRVEDMISDAGFRELLLSFVDVHLRPLEDQIELIGYDHEIAPGIASIAAQGHTPGHMALRVESGEDVLWLGGDVGFGPLTLTYPDLLGLPDVEPERMIETRMQLYGRIAEEGGILTLVHANPFPSLGHVVEAGETWQWESVNDDMASPTA